MQHLKQGYQDPQWYYLQKEAAGKAEDPEIWKPRAHTTFFSLGEIKSWQKEGSHRKSPRKALRPTTYLHHAWEMDKERDTMLCSVN